MDHLTTFEEVREITGWVRPGHDHGCKPVEVIPGLWTAHYNDIDSIEKESAFKHCNLCMAPSPDHDYIPCDGTPFLTPCL